jgi:N-alpha-acetyl-L-2,4-diaminobutyrate deacetylase
MLAYGPVSTELDLESPGKRSGFLNLEHSDNAHAFGLIRPPLGVISGSDGPTLMMTAGSHGDEYEGQAILHQIMQRFTPADIKGRLILLPALNLPAIEERARVSPIDNGNMNRSFPGDPNGGPTRAIAAFVNHHLLPRVDAVIDFHSGGTSAQYVDCGFLCWGADDGLNQANLDLADAFGADFTMLAAIDGTGGDFDTAAHQQGKRFLACELGGMGGFSPSSFTVGWQGMLGILHHLGMTSTPPSESPGATRLIDVAKDVSHVTAAHHGLAQWQMAPGERVQKGDPVATIYDIHNFGEIRAELAAPRSGIVAIRRRNPLVSPGDHLFMLCRELNRNKDMTNYGK